MTTYNYDGKPVDEMTRNELVEALKVMFELSRKQQELGRLCNHEPETMAEMIGELGGW